MSLSNIATPGLICGGGFRYIYSNDSKYRYVCNDRYRNRHYTEFHKGINSIYMDIRDNTKLSRYIGIYRGCRYQSISTKDYVSDSPTVTKYNALISDGTLQHSEAQSLYIQRLAVLEKTILEYLKDDKFNTRFERAKRQPDRIDVPKPKAHTTGPAGGLFRSIRKNVSGALQPTSYDMIVKDHHEDQSESQIRQFAIHPLVKPLYLYGSVGGGKTRLTNLFYDSIELEEMQLCEVFSVDEANKYKKMRIHFHEFMLRVQYLIHSRRHADMIPLADMPSWLESLALYEIAYRVRNSGVVFIYLDEFQVTNISDALILKPLFEALVHFGVSIVTTSNRPPSELYYRGLNRDQFLPFVGFVQKEWKVVQLDAETDFRSIQIDNGVEPEQKGSEFIKKVLNKIDGMWISKGNTEKEIEELILSCDPDRPMRTAAKLPLIGGRFFLVPFSISSVAVCSFKDLFETNIGSADYLGLSTHYELLYIHSIPNMRDMSQNPNAVRRFITFVDICYENSLRCIFDSKCKILDLFPHTDGVKAMCYLIRSLCLRRSNTLTIRDLVKPIGTGNDIVKFQNCRKVPSSLLNPRLSDNYKRHINILNKLFPHGVTANDLISHIKFHIDNADVQIKNKKIIMDQDIQSKPYPVTYQQRDEIENQENEFAYLRTLSRLMEMTQKREFISGN